MGTRPAVGECGLSRPVLYLIDGNSYCYRAYYALGHLSNSSGQSTNAVYGFVNMLGRLLTTEKPEYLGICFDSKEPSFRHRKFAEYKIHRPGMPLDLVSQLPIIKEIVSALAVPAFERPGFEADDLIATITRRATEEDFEVAIVTGDKDMLQLVGPRVRVHNTHKEGLVYDAGQVQERYGVPPEKIVEIMALMGDASDNIPGVPGIGEKTAVRLIQEFGSLEEVLAGRNRMKDKLAAALGEFAEQARMSRELATLDTAVPLALDFRQFKMGIPDREKLKEIFTRLEFKRLPGFLGLEEETLLSPAPEEEERSRDYRLLEGEEQVRELVRILAGQEWFAFHLDGDRPEPLAAAIRGIAFCRRDGEAGYVSLAGTGRERLLALLGPVLADEKVKKAGHNLKYAMMVLDRNGIRLGGAEFDAMIASYLLNPQKTNHGLAEIGREYLHYRARFFPLPEETNREGETKPEIFRGGCEAAELSWRLKEKLWPRLPEEELARLFSEIEMPLVRVLADMESAGVAVDTAFLSRLAGEMEKSLEALSGRAYQLAGEEFNLNSPRQLSVVLFEKLKLPKVKRTKTGDSTDGEVLTKLARLHPLPALLLEYRELAKLKHGYADALPRLVNPRTGRVHTTFNQTVTATGRLSSSDPNLQNIPIKTEEGKRIREAFVAGKKGTCLLSADYSQIELRILAHLSADGMLREAFRRDRDIHRYTGSLVFGVEESEVTGEMRATAKTVNFGIIYGMSAYGLARELGIKPEEAKAFISAYFERYPGVKDFLDRQIAEAKQRGYVTTLFSRRRYVPEIRSQNQAVRQFGERVAVNTAIQGTAADLIKKAMVAIHRRLGRGRPAAVMTLQVHDELVFEVPEEGIEEVSRLVREEMEGAAALSVALKVDIQTGRNWREI